MLTVWGRRNAFNVQKVMWLVDGSRSSIGTCRPAGSSAYSTRPRFSQ